VLPAQEDENKAKENAREHDEKRKFDADTFFLSKVTVGLIFLQVLIFAVQAYFLWGTLNVTAVAATAAKDAANAAKKSADASLLALRPWISCKVEIAGPVTYTTAGDAQFELRFIVKNVGHSPAFGVKLTPALNLLSPKHGHSVLKLQRMAHLNRDMPIDAPAVLLPGEVPIGGAEPGLILFPAEIFTFNYKIPISREEIEASFEDIKPNRYFAPEVFGLVTYLYPLAAIRPDTGFVCSIDNVSPDSESGLAFELDKPVRPEYTRVADASLWSGFAS
jgi:hypothetical protein